MKKQNWEKELKDLPAINYNLYIGSGADACDNCLDFEVAFNQLKFFISNLLSQEKENWIEELEARQIKE